LLRVARWIDPDLDVGGGDVQPFFAHAGADHDAGALSELEERQSTTDSSRRVTTFLHR
jgi:hypothetical protein